ncbi:MAG TPA: hypothetical protein DHI91_00700 [Candidatus Portnoybacteria bacterium]|nr:hypothetical protein [Candidatus Portnoybacteria bacterium]
MKEETKQTLISYYKWVVSLSIFVIGFSVSIVSVIDKLRFSVMLKWGVALLLVSIFVNWLAIKKLVTYSVIETEQAESGLARFFVKTLSILKIYGLLQNWLFIVGLILIILSFMLGENRVPVSFSL